MGRTIKKNTNSLFKTNVKSSEKFKSEAEIHFEKKREKERKLIYDEIERRNLGYRV